MRVSRRTIKKRRKEFRTDYVLRKKLLESNTPRIVIRKTNKYFIIQVVESSEAQDRVIMTTISKELLKNGWDEKYRGSLKSISAGYLTGLLVAKKLKKGKFIVDLGIARKIHGSRIYAVVKGLIDGGVDIVANEKIFPSDERLKGEHLKSEVKEMIIKAIGKIK
ncbi:MAG: 50S ribosomal protein L18 [Candidatus Pacearchaeota archaeon]